MEFKLSRNLPISPLIKVKKKKARKDLDLLRHHILNTRNRRVKRHGHNPHNAGKKNSFAKILNNFTQAYKSKKTIIRNENKKKSQILDKKLLLSKPCIGIYRNGAKSKPLRKNEGITFSDDRKHLTNKSESESGSPASIDNSSSYKILKRTDERPEKARPNFTTQKVHVSEKKMMVSGPQLRDNSSQEVIKFTTMNDNIVRKAARLQKCTENDIIPVKNENMQSIKRWHWSPITCFEEVCVKISQDYLMNNELICELPDPIAKSRKILRDFYVLFHKRHTSDDIMTENYSKSNKLQKMNESPEKVSTAFRPNSKQNIVSEKHRLSFNMDNQNETLSPITKKAIYEKVYYQPNVTLGYVNADKGPINYFENKHDNSYNTLQTTDVSVENLTDAFQFKEKMPVKSIPLILRKSSFTNAITCQPMISKLNTKKKSINHGPFQIQQDKIFEDCNELSSLTYKESLHTLKLDKKEKVRFDSNLFVGKNRNNESHAEPKLKRSRSIEMKNWNDHNCQWNRHLPELHQGYKQSWDRNDNNCGISNRNISNPVSNDFKRHIFQENPFAQSSNFIATDQQYKHPLQLMKYALQSDYSSSLYPQRVPDDKQELCYCNNTRRNPYHQFMHTNTFVQPPLGLFGTYNQKYRQDVNLIDERTHRDLATINNCSITHPAMFNNQQIDLFSQNDGQIERNFLHKKKNMHHY